jgi:methyltransferase
MIARNPVLDIFRQLQHCLDVFCSSWRPHNTSESTHLGRDIVNRSRALTNCTITIYRVFSDIAPFPFHRTNSFTLLFINGTFHSIIFMLQFRRALVPMHTDLRYAGMLPPLDAPHHLRASEWGHFREGIVTSSEPCKGSFVNVGLDKEAHLEQAVRQGVRITIEMGSTADVGVVDGTEVYLGKLAAPADPRKQIGQYWGYYTRIAPSFDDLFNSSPYPGGYDLTIGTSERGEPVGGCDLRLKRFKHALIVIGGPQGLEYALSNDVSADKYPDGDPSGLFDRYLNTCHNQGSRTIRTEEALLITMAFLQPALTKAGG